MGVPTAMYRRAEDGSVESRVFDSDAIPEGWVDSPAKVEEKPRKVEGGGVSEAPEEVSASSTPAVNVVLGRVTVKTESGAAAPKRRGRPKKRATE